MFTGYNDEEVLLCLPSPGQSYMSKISTTKGFNRLCWGCEAQRKDVSLALSPKQCLSHQDTFSRASFLEEAAQESIKQRQLVYRAELTVNLYHVVHCRRMPS